jgi:hypothetical protein
LPARFHALLLAAGFLLLSLAFFPRAYDGSAFTYFILAQEGLYKAAQEAHPLYLPLLRALSSGLAAVGLGGWALPGGQLLSLLGGAGCAALLFRLCARAPGAAGTSAAAASLLFVLQRQAWWLSGQTKPYSLSAFFALLSLTLLFAPPRGGPPRPALAGAALAASVGLHAVNAALFPVVWLLARFAGTDRRALAAFHGAALAPCLLWLALLPDVFWAMLARMQDYAAHRSWTAQGAAADAWARHAGHVRSSMPEVPYLLAPLLAAGAAPWRDAEVRRRAAAAALCAASFSAAFVVFDAKNDYSFVLTLLAPPLLAAACRTSAARAILAAAAVAIGAATLKSDIFPGSRPGAEPAREEADTLAALCGPEGLALAAGAPDWRLAWFARGRVRLLRADGLSDFDPPSEAVSERALAEVDETLRRGAPVYLAADRLVRPGSAWDDARTDAYQAKVVAALERGHRLAPPAVSPRGQRYIPVLRRQPPLRRGRITGHTPP